MLDVRRVYWQLLSALCLQIGMCAGAANTSQLMSVLFESGYSSSIRPRLNPTQPIYIYTSLKLYFVESLDLRTQILVLFAQVDLDWKDDFLRWNPSDYGGLQKVTVPADNIWRPDILFLDSAEAYYEDVDLFSGNFPATLAHDGTVVWSTAGRLTALCPLDMSFFPFDLQECSFAMGSWASLAGEVTYQVRERQVDNVTFYTENREFSIVESTAQTFIYEEEEFGEDVQRSEAQFSVTLQRRPVAYILNIFCPCVVISMMGPFTFLLPPDASDRVGLSVTLLLAFTVYLLVLSDSMPPGGQSLPLISMYVLSCLLLTTLVLFIVVLLSHLQSHPDNSPRGLARSCVLRCLAPVFCYWRLLKQENKRLFREAENASSEKNSNVNNANHVAETLTRKNSLNKKFVSESDGTAEDAGNFLEIKEMNKAQWISVIKVLDRFFFFVFLLVTVLLNVGFLVFYRASSKSS